MSQVIPFAGLAPDARIVRGRGLLAEFDLRSAVDLGIELRRACAGDVSRRDVAQALVDGINAFEHDRRPACVLVRAFVSCRFEELPPDAQASVIGASPPREIAADARCLRLVATRGIEPEWNDERRSTHHGAMLFERGGSPMVDELLRQLGSGDSTASLFYVADPVASPAVRAKDFVRSYGVQTVFGFGVTAWPGETIVVIAFARVSLTRESVRDFENVALYAKLAWLNVRERNLDAVAYERVRAEALDELVGRHEIELRESALEHRRRLDAARAEAQLAADGAASKVEEHNRELRRAQRAMVNVIEDLREAREELASKVEVRTRELALANRLLEMRNRELEEFVYIASHDLQEPLRTVAGYLQMIQRRYGTKLGVEADEFITFAIEGAQRMQALIESLLLYSRVATADRTFDPVPLDEAVDTALRNLALRIEESSATIVRSPLPTVRADRIQMVQLFQNLLSNALKFSGPGKPPRVHITSELGAEGHTITVRDEGIGFHPRFVDRIFKVFRRLRRDTPGTGIGLAVCKKIVERHGGHIEATSTPGEGSTFIVHLPTQLTTETSHP